MKMSDVVQHADAILALEKLEHNPPMRLQVKLARNLRLLRRQLETYEKAVETAIKELGEELDDGRWVIPSTNVEAKTRFTREHEELLAMDVDIDIHPITAEEYSEAQAARPNFNIPMASLVELDFLFDLED